MAGRVRTLAGLSLLALMMCGRVLAAAAPAPPEPAPSAELLLFLAEFRDARGEPVDPIELDEQPAAKGTSEESDTKPPRAPAKSEPDEAEPPPPH